MVSYIRSDLEFILAQIEIAEAHAAGAPLYGPGGLIPANNISWGLRTVDGTYNNLLPGRENWGAADQEFPEQLEPVFRDGEAFDLDGPGPGGTVPTNYDPSDDPNSIVVDSSLRTISNLIVDQTISNPAAVERFIEAGLGVDVAGVLHHVDENGLPGDVVQPGETLTIPNVSPDEGLSASFNSWFTLFGQFFDHGLDLVNKGGSGTVFVPLNPDDPLYDADGADDIPNSGDETNFMVLTRATVSAGEDGIMGTADDVRPVNTTTSFVDQNQTYTSHPAHQVFLREYALSGAPDAVPVATGSLITGQAGGMATWAEVKAQAREMLGINLTDADVGNGPLLAVDQYGNFLRGPNGFPQVVFPGANPGDPPILIEGDPSAVSLDDQGNPVSGISTLGAVRTGHAFLADIAHEAVPIGKIADGDITIGLGNPGNGDTEYDNELLDAHFIAGDGRANENIGLTAVHHVFHAEHNRLVQHTKDVILATGDNAFIQQWLVPGANIGDGVQDLEWNGERLFQAAKFGTEMQYQHLVFEEFARKVQPQIDAFLVPDGFDVDMDPTIVAEFAHVVYRFGHSMLTESIDRYDAAFTPDHIGLIQGFLNPSAFDDNGAIDHDVAAGAIIRGMTRQVGNEIDEFVTGALRNNLLGLPLDLATINLARGRDTGVPSLNAVRRDFYEQTNNAAELRPYESWTDFASNIKNPASIINFVAAYGLHPLITGETTIEGKRDAALTIITGASVNGMEVPADAADFLNGTGDWASDANGVTVTGLDNVDLWIGGLAEKILPFGGMLGSTFNFVFETQMENLQSGDRFYYLQRLDGLHLFGEMENNSFASMIMRNTDATHLPSDVFSTPGLILEVDQNQQFTGIGDGHGDPVGGSILTPLVIRDNPGTAGPDTNYLRYTGDDHVVLGGTPVDDIIISSIGDDALYGDEGNDRLEGGAGNDVLNGGDGDDIIRDLGGDDNIKAGTGNDVVHAGPGLDLVLGGAGKDFIVTGSDAGTEVFAGEGDDFILGNKTAERILGNEGNDWIEIGTFDGAPGDNFDEIFARDGVPGHDVFLGDGGFDEYIGEGGDDIMVGSPGRGKLVGMSGFDWATYKDFTTGADADLFRLAFDELPVIPPNQGLETYEGIEGLSGSAFDDFLGGSDVDAAQMPLEGFLGSVLTSEGIARITGLQAVVGAGVTSFGGGNIILGGGGNDVIEGRGGDDIIDGDKWLNVTIGVRVGDTITEEHKSMKTLVNKMFSGEINPDQLEIVREIETATNPGNDTIDGGEGNDILTGGAGRDLLTGGVGDDRYVYSAASDSPVSAVGRDVITDFAAGDIIDLSTIDANALVAGHQEFTFLGQQAANNNIAAGLLKFFQTGGNTYVVGGTDADAPAEFQIQITGLHALTVASFLGVAAPVVPAGTPGPDNLVGTAGNDILSGLGGNDVLTGLGGQDMLSGGTGNDRFVYTAVTDSPLSAGGRDHILDFAPGDSIDLSAIDADPGTAGDQAFTFLGQQVPNNLIAAGQMKFYQTGGNTYVVGGNDADAPADFQIQLIGLHNLTAADFVL